MITDQLKSVQPIQNSVDAVNKIVDSGVTVAVASNYTGETKEAWMRVAHHFGFKVRASEPTWSRPLHPDGLRPYMSLAILPQVDEAMSCADVPNPGRDGFKVRG